MYTTTTVPAVTSVEIAFTSGRFVPCRSREKTQTVNMRSLPTVKNVTVKLFDPKRKTLLAAADCAYSPEYADSDEAPTRDELLADNARGLKAELKKGADHCLQKFLSETFV